MTKKRDDNATFDNILRGTNINIRDGEGIEPHNVRDGEGVEPHNIKDGEGVEPRNIKDGEGVEPRNIKDGEGVEPHSIQDGEGIEPTESDKSSKKLKESMEEPSKRGREFKDVEKNVNYGTFLTGFATSSPTAFLAGPLALLIVVGWLWKKKVTIKKEDLSKIYDKQYDREYSSGKFIDEILDSENMEDLEKSLNNHLVREGVSEADRSDVLNLVRNAMTQETFEDAVDYIEQNGDSHFNKVAKGALRIITEYNELTLGVENNLFAKSGNRGSNRRNNSGRNL